MKSTNMLERLNQELKRRTHVVRIFPNAESCLRLVRRWPSRCTRAATEPYKAAAIGRRFRRMGLETQRYANLLRCAQARARPRR
jgi:transposase-like protein